MKQDTSLRDRLDSDRGTSWNMGVFVGFFFWVFGGFFAVLKLSDVICLKMSVFRCRKS